MAATILAAEEEGERPRIQVDEHLIGAPIPYTIAEAVSSTDQFCKTKVIFALTSSGYTAGLISNLYPANPVIALSSDQAVRNFLTLYRSVYSVPIQPLETIDDMLRTVNDISKRFKLAGVGETVTITGGFPFGSKVPTNLMMIHVVA